MPINAIHAILAQVPTPAPTPTPGPIVTPTSGDFWNPANWSSFVSAVGIPGFFAIVLFGFFIWFVYKALDKWDGHLTRQERLTATQLTLCRQVHRPGGTANVSDFRDAGHDLADVLQSLGEGISPATGDKVKPRIDRIHEKLRSIPPPLPTELGADSA